MQLTDGGIAVTVGGGQFGMAFDDAKAMPFGEDKLKRESKNINNLHVFAIPPAVSYT